MRMTQPQRRHFVASQACLGAFGGAAPLARLWGAPPRECIDLAGAGNHDARPGDAYLLLFDLRLDMARAQAVQRRLVGAGATVVLLGVAPGALRIGPVVLPGAGRCLHCLEQWIDNNHRSPRSFKDADADHGGDRPTPYRPFSPAARHAVAGLLSALLAEAGEEDGRLPPGAWYAVRIDSLEVFKHRFIQLTGCPSCDIAPVPTQPRALRFVPRIKRRALDKRVPNALLSLAAVRRQFVDRHCGLIKHVFKNMQSDLMPLFTSERPFAGSASTDYNHGRAFNYQTSELIAILEGIERYAGNEPRDAMVSLRGSRAQMVARFGEQVIDPALFILHTAEQQANPLFKFETWSEQLECGWIWAHSLRRQAPVLIPEQLGYYNIKSRPGVPANRFVYDSSNGGALGGSIEEAVLGGVHEVVERDAYFSTWYSRIAPVRIDPRSVDDRHSAALIARAEAAGFDIHLFDMTSEAGIPVVGAMIVDPANDARVKSYCASACEGRWSGAIFSALAEVTTSMGVYGKNQALDREHARAMFDDASLVQDMFDHVLLYSLNETFERLAFLLGGEMRSLQECRRRVPDTVTLDLAAELEADCARVLAIAADIIVVDQTFAELRKLGLAAAKVLVPGLMPVTFGHQYQRIDLGRLNRFARYRGRPELRFTAADLNPYPHNFP